MTSVRLTWTPRFSPDLYRVYRSIAPLDTSSLPDEIETIIGESSSYIDNGVTQGEEYYYIIEAVILSPEASVFTRQINVTATNASSTAPTPEFVNPTTVNAALWRLKIDATQAGGYTSIGSLEFYGFDGKIEAIEGVDGVASASSVGFSLPASNAFDGNSATLWHSGNSTMPVGGEWLLFTFTNDVAPTEIAITARNSGSASSYVQTPSNGSLQYSVDGGSSWNDWIDFAAEAWTDYGQQQSFAREGYSVSELLASGKNKFAFYRVAVLSPSAAVSIAELEFRETIGGVQSALGGEAFASSTLSGYPASNAFDGNSATFWHNDGSPIVGYHFPSEVSIREVAITNRLGYESQAPTSFSVEVSINGFDFTDLKNETYLQAGWTGQETRTNEL